MIPTSIDGTDITGATIDGTDVTEITVDGQSVFTSAPQINLPVAADELVAWYNFENGDASDATAGNQAFKDSNAYDGQNVNGSFPSTGGVTDLNNGANSGFYDTTGGEEFEVPAVEQYINVSPFTITFWANLDGGGSGWTIGYWASGDKDWLIRVQDGAITLSDDNNVKIVHSTSTSTTGRWVHLGCVFGSPNRLVLDGVEVATEGASVNTTFSADELSIGSLGTERSDDFNGGLDDVRVYDAALSTSEINQIYLNTEP